MSEVSRSPSLLWFARSRALDRNRARRVASCFLRADRNYRGQWRERVKTLAPARRCDESRGQSEQERARERKEGDDGGIKIDEEPFESWRRSISHCPRRAF